MKWKVFLFFTFSLSTFNPSLIQAQTSSAPSSVQNFDDFGFYKKFGKTSKSWNDFVQKGFEAYDRQDCEGTISLLKEAIKAGCDDPIVLFKVAACSELTGSYYSAVQYYQQIETGLQSLRSPHRYQKDFFESYGRILYLNKKIDEALPYLLKAADQGTPSFTLYYMLGEIFSAKQQAKQATEYYQKGLQQPLDQASPAQLSKVYGIVALSYFELKNWPKVIELADKGFQLTPDPALQQLKYKASEMQRQEKMFETMDTLMNPNGNQTKKKAESRPATLPAFP